MPQNVRLWGARWHASTPRLFSLYSDLERTSSVSSELPYCPGKYTIPLLRRLGVGPRIAVANLANTLTTRTSWTNQIKEHGVSSAKDAMIDIIGRQPEDSSYDEILRELAFARMVQRGLDDSDADRTVSDEDVKGKIHSWQR